MNRQESPSAGNRIRIVGYASLFDQAAMAPMLLRISNNLQIELGHVASLVAGYYFFYGVMQIFWGWYSSSHGYVKTMKISLLVSASSTLLCIFATTYSHLLVFRCISGAFLSASVPAAISYIGSTNTVNQTHKQISGLMVATSAGTASSTILSATISWFFGWQYVFLLSAAISYIAYIRIRGLSEKADSKLLSSRLKALKVLLKHRPMQVLLSISFVDGGALIGTLVFIPSSLEHQGVQAIFVGIVTMMYGCTVLVVSILLRRITKHLNLSIYITIGSYAGALASLLMMLSKNLLTSLTACILLGIAAATMHSSIQTWSTEVFPVLRSLAISLFAAFLFLGGSASSQFNGSFVDQSKYTWLFGQSLLLFLIIATFGAGFRRKLERQITLCEVN